MVDRAFLCQITEVSAGADVGQIVVRWQCCYNSDDGRNLTMGGGTGAFITDTVNQLGQKIAADIRAIGAANGFDVTAAGSIFMPNFQKV